MSKWSELQKLFEDLIKKGGSAEQMGIRPDKIDCLRKTPFIKKPLATLMTTCGNAISKLVEGTEFVYQKIFKGEVTSVINATSWVMTGTCVLATCMSKDLDNEEKWTLILSEIATTAGAGWANTHIGKRFEDFSKKSVLPKFQEINPDLRRSTFSRTWGDAVKVVTSTSIFRFGAPVFAAPFAMYLKRKYFDYKKSMNRLNDLDRGINEIDVSKADMKAIRNNIGENQKKILKRDLDQSMMKRPVAKPSAQIPQPVTTLRVA